MPNLKNSFYVLVLGIAFLPRISRAADLIGDSSYAGLRLVRGHVGLRWTIDDGTLTAIGADASFRDRLATAVYQKLQKAGVDMTTSGTLGSGPTLTMFMWAGQMGGPGSKCGPGSIKIIPYKYEFTLTVPAASLTATVPVPGAVIVWEDEVYGTIGSDPALVDALTKRFVALIDVLTHDLKTTRIDRAF
jgi:hypothetical protein